MLLEMATLIMVLASLGAVGGFAQSQTQHKACKKTAELSSAIAGLKGQIEFENCKISNLTKSHIQNALKQYGLAVKYIAANDYGRSLSCAEAGLIETAFAKQLLSADTAEQIFGEGEHLDIEEKSGQENLNKAQPCNFPSNVQPALVSINPSARITVMPINNQLTPRHIQELLNTLGLPLDDDLSRSLEFFDEPGMGSTVGKEINSIFGINVQITTTKTKKTKTIKLGKGPSKKVSLNVFKSVRKTRLR